MKSTALLIFFGMMLMFQSCEKKTIIQPTELPQELQYLKGNWKVVNYYYDSFSGQAKGDPRFDELKFSENSVALYLNNAFLEEQQFHFSKEGKLGIYRVSFAGRGVNEFDAPLDHYVSNVNDTLRLTSVIVDGGIDYRLVKE